MSKPLPTGWIVATLEDIVLTPLQDIVDGPFGSRLKSKDYQDSGLPVIRLQNIERNDFVEKNIPFVSKEKAEELERHSFVEGDIAITKLGDPLGKAAIIPLKEGIVVADIVRIRLDTKFADPRFVTYAINSPLVAKSLESKTKGTTRPRVNLNHIRKLAIPFAPRNEQEEIAGKLDTLLTRVNSCQEQLNRVQLIIERFRQSVLSAAISGELTEAWRVQNPPSKKWPLAELNQVCFSITDGSHQAPPKTETGIPFITISNINDGLLKLERATRFVSQDYYDQLKTIRRPKVDDVLFSVTGSLGIPVLVDTNDPFVFQRHIAILRPDPSKILSKFLFYMLATPDIKFKAESIATGTAQMTIPLRRLRVIEIPLPPLEEQENIVRRIETLFEFADRIEARFQKAQTQVEHLIPTLLDKAFKGELVPQHPNDEPASVLLGRIQEARANTPAPQKKPRRRSEMADKKTNRRKKTDPVSIVQALSDAGQELSASDLFIEAGYPSDAGSEQIETFFVAVRDSLINKEISKTRRHDIDWFTLESERTANEN